MAITTTRADYGIMSDLLKELQNSAKVDLKLVVSGTHISEKFGTTIHEIINDGIEVSHVLDFPLEDETEAGLCASTGGLLRDFGKLLGKEKPDLIMVLGDRFEILAPVTCAVIRRIPVAHIHGGETTLGAIDNKIRDAITQMADIHFAATSMAAGRIRKLKPNSNGVHHVGSLSVDRLSHLKLMDRVELAKNYGWSLDDKAAIITYHPETMSLTSPLEQVEELIKVLDEYQELFMVITLSNADVGGRAISRRLNEFASERKNVVVHASLGQEAYLSCLASFDLVIGNSSSAIIEAPIFGLPTVNIGGRQTGREMAPSVINVDCKYESIKAGVDDALRRPRHLKQNIYDLPYGKLGATASILAVLEQFSSKQVRSV